MPSLFVNGGTIQGVAAPQLYDESTAVQILSPNALVETAFRETSQYAGWRGFAGVLKALVRLIDTLFSSVPSLSNAIPQAVGTASAGVGTPLLVTTTYTPTATRRATGRCTRQ